MMQQKQSYAHMVPGFWLGVIFIIVGGIYILLRGEKEKKDFYQITGRINFLENTHPEINLRQDPKDRYLEVSGYPKLFKLYLGGDQGDFLPKFQAISELKVGDTITVFYDENQLPSSSANNDEVVNQLVQYIEKENQTYYIRGDIDKFLGNFLIIMGVLIGCFLYAFRNKF